ncbi:MAG TPA: ABC transporter permease [Candidatus Intestinimonas stercorigallinarum]|nr:ABC transporter permease [Candidatus Intestinimonas stercorigallinarum]
MKTYVIRRLLQLIPVLFGISVLIFAVMKMIPGDVISGILGVDATPELREQLREIYGLDRPYVVQYLDWIGGVLRGDFGESIRTGEPILPQILTRFKVTAELTILAAIISWIIAIPLGILAAVKRNSMADRFVRVFALLGVSVPNFALSILLILFLSLVFNYFSPLGYVGFFEDPIRNLQIMILPASILGVSIAGSVMRMTRSSVLEVLRQDFVRTVRAKGASERVAIFRHVLRNALIPIITLVGMQIGSLLGGAVIVEQIFSLPGLGQMTLTGINQRDYPVVQGCVLFIAFVYVLVNLVTDLLYSYIDPRISYD